jgi:hypothetical protein
MCDVRFVRADAVRPDIIHPFIIQLSKIPPNMKLTLRSAFLIALFSIFSLSAHAQGKTNDLGAGIILGEPTGISAKWWNSGDRAIDLAVAWSTGRNDRFNLHGDYLIHRFDLISVDAGKLPVYYGIGARAGFGDQVDLGVRIPVGIAYQFPNDPFELFFEIVPVLNLYPATDFDANGGFGVRYYFGKVR